MTHLYEGMFLLDNQVVREDWKRAKSLVTDTLAKHGAKVVSARRWDERRLAYPIRRRQRGTFCLAYFESAGDTLPVLRRDLDLSENVLRYLMLRCESVPATERELAQAEDAAGFSVPPPPADDAPDQPRAAPMGRRAPAEGEEPEIDPALAEETPAGTEA